MMVFTAVVVLTGCKKGPSEPAPNENPEPTKSEIPTPATPTTTKSETPMPVKSKNSLTDVVRNAKYWGPAFTSLYNKEAPGFTLTDINGKEHKLSDYKGKNVVVVFWATWCPPCKMMVPHLMNLRDEIGEDKLAILGISNISDYPPNTEKMIKDFAVSTKINYTICAVERGSLGAPYNTVESLPSCLFIDPAGKFKLGSSGIVSLDEFKAIIEGEWP